MTRPVNKFKNLDR